MVVVAELGKRLGPSLWCRWAQAGAAPDETELDEEEEDSKDLLDAVGECCWPSWRPSGCSSGLNLRSEDAVQRLDTCQKEVGIMSLKNHVNEHAHVHAHISCYF